MCSHLGGTNKWLRGMTGRADSGCAMCIVQVKASSKINRWGELFESWRRLQQGTWTLY